MNVSKPTPAFSDDRGTITDILYKEPVDAIAVIESRKGVVRGNHYHKDTIQWTLLHSGRLKYFCQVGDGPIETRVIEPGDLIVSAAMEKHALLAMEDSVFYVFTRGPRGGQDYERDTYRLEVPICPPGQM
jgi:hypothetical protein